MTDERCIFCGDFEDENAEHDGIPTGVHAFLPPSKCAEVQMWVAERHEAFIAGMRANKGAGPDDFGSGTPVSDEEEAAFQRYAALRQPRLLRVPR